MMKTLASRRVIAVFACALLLAACGGGTSDVAEEAGQSPVTTEAEGHADDVADHDDGAADHADDHDDDHADDHEHAFAFGEPGDPSDADRVIEVVATDDFAFDPAVIEVSAGETIMFTITNSGKIPHDFTLGDEAAQVAHEAEMQEMMSDGGDMSMHSDANAVLVPAGKTVDLTWTFSEAGSVLFGCHQPGHYAAGMVGTVDVTS